MIFNPSRGRIYVELVDADLLNVFRSADLFENFTPELFFMDVAVFDGRFTITTMQYNHRPGPHTRPHPEIHALLRDLPHAALSRLAANLDQILDRLQPGSPAPAHVDIVTTGWAMKKWNMSGADEVLAIYTDYLSGQQFHLVSIPSDETILTVDRPYWVWRRSLADVLVAAAHRLGPPPRPPVSPEDLSSNYEGYNEQGRHEEKKLIFSQASRSPGMRAYLADLIGAYGRRLDILSVGGGPGQSEEEWRNAGHRVTTIDILHAHAHAARRRGLQSIVADAHALPLRDPRYDVVIFSKSLGHMDLRHALHEGQRRLRPGGIMIATSYQMEAGENREEILESTTYLMHSQGEIASAMAAAGLEVVMTDRKDFTEESDGRSLINIFVGRKENGGVQNRAAADAARSQLRIGEDAWSVSRILMDPAKSSPELIPGLLRVFPNVRDIVLTVTPEFVAKYPDASVWSDTEPGQTFLIRLHERREAWRVDMGSIKIHVVTTDAQNREGVAPRPAGLTAVVVSNRETIMDFSPDAPPPHLPATNLRPNDILIEVGPSGSSAPGPLPGALWQRMVIPYRPDMSSTARTRRLTLRDIDPDDLSYAEQRDLVHHVITRHFPMSPDREKAFNLFGDALLGHPRKLSTFDRLARGIREHRAESPLLWEDWRDLTDWMRRGPVSAGGAYAIDTGSRHIQYDDLSDELLALIVRHRIERDRFRVAHAAYLSLTDRQRSHRRSFLRIYQEYLEVEKEKEDPEFREPEKEIHEPSPDSVVQVPARPGETFDIYFDKRQKTLFLRYPSDSPWPARLRASNAFESVSDYAYFLKLAFARGRFIVTTHQGNHPTDAHIRNTDPALDTHIRSLPGSAFDHFYHHLEELLPFGWPGESWPLESVDIVSAGQIINHWPRYNAASALRDYHDFPLDQGYDFVEEPAPPPPGPTPFRWPLALAEVHP